MALVHDSKTGRYYHPADGWYAGGMEVIVYPEKMRSIYVRASLGVDLTEVKNLSGLTLRGKAKRDGESITEIFSVYPLRTSNQRGRLYQSDTRRLSDCGFSSSESVRV